MEGGGTRAPPESPMKLGILFARGATAGNGSGLGQERRWQRELSAYRGVFEEIYEGGDYETLKSCSVLRVTNLTGVWPAILVEQAYGIPFVLHLGYEHSAVARIHGKRWRAFGLQVLRRVALLQADAVIVHARHLLSEREWRRFPHCTFIPNGVDCDLFRPWGGDKFPPPRVVLYVGRQAKEKNLDRLRAACKGLPPDTRLAMVGGTTHSVVSERATLWRTVPVEALRGFYWSASVFALPSLTEGCPKAFLEAMACGVPSVVSDRVRGIGQPGITHVDCDPLEVKDIRLSIELALDPDYGRQIAATALEYVRSHHDINDTLKREVAIVAACAKR